MNETAPSRPEVCEHGSLRRKCEICECHDEIASLRSENEAQKAAIEQMMVGGNHIASVLIGTLGGGFHNDYPADMDHGKAHTKLARAGRNQDTYEVWCCWSAMMRARTALQSKGGSNG